MVARDKIVLVFGLFLMCCCKQTYSECRQVSTCSCIYANGEGFNLSPLADHSPLVGVVNNSTYFYFHPCTNQKLTTNSSSECYKGNGVSLCAINGNDSFVLGKAEETTILAEQNIIAVIHFNHNNLSTDIILECCSSCETVLLPPANVDAKYILLLRSPYACQKLLEKGLSVGSLLLIYFFVFSGIYFIGGAIGLKFLRGATGWEMIPNHKFWLDLPSLISEGVAFTFNCCRVVSYERI